MDYQYLVEKFKGQRTKVGIIGATRGYGYTIVVQLLYSPMCSLRLICSRHPEECVAVLKSVGYDPRLMKICTSESDINAADPDDILVVSDYSLIPYAGLNTVVECTGNVSIGARVAELALGNNINVCMVSKETDSVNGPYFTNLARTNNLIYTLANGDQPRNLVDLVSWVRSLGLEVICAGKSSENDVIVNPKTWEVTYLEDHPSIVAPDLAGVRTYNGIETLKARKSILSGLLGPISADLCEMNLVSNITGLKPAAIELSYPVARITELADIFVPVEDGGILSEKGVVDVFFDYRYEDEVSFGGGEFVIVRCNDSVTWEMLREKGHIVGRNGKYACIFWPYHLLGVETPTTVMLMDFMGIGLHNSCRQVSILAGKASRRLCRGSFLKVAGHHHSIDGVSPQIYETGSAPGGTMPFYLLNGAELLADIDEGDLITSDKVKIDASLADAFKNFNKGLSL